jgi:hypothetical protein
MIQNNNFPDTDWLESFSLQSQDYDYLINLLLEAGTPWSTEEVVLALLDYKLKQEQEKNAIVSQDKGLAEAYSPIETYKSGQKVYFPLLDGLSGKVMSIRNGHSPDCSDFEVMQVLCEDHTTREFAISLNPSDVSDDFNYANNGDADILSEFSKQILQKNTPMLENKIQADLLEYRELVRLSGYWFPVDLLVDINAGYLNLVEAALDFADGRPLATKEFLYQIGITGESDEALLIFSLNYALQIDDRFEDVGPTGQVLWFLSSMKPRDIITSEKYLVCDTANCLVEPLTADMKILSMTLRDEFSENIATKHADGPVEVVLTYPHLKAGTLPLSAHTAHVFPSALVSPRVKITFVDGLSGESFPGWVAQKERFVWGMGPLYKRYDVIAGARITISPGSDLSQSIVHVDRCNPIKEWVRTLLIEDGRFYFELRKRDISVGYVEENMICVEDSSSVKDLCEQLLHNGVTLEKIVERTFRELSKLTPQGNVHAHTLYSAVNVIRRIPPEPILVVLCGDSCYKHVGDAYWRYEAQT